jgi:hypothetical protein
MRSTVRSRATLLAFVLSLPMSACGGHDSADQGARAVPASAAITPSTPASNEPMGGAPMGGAPMAAADTVPRVHHSMMKGAIVGAVAGHIAGRHALAGAAAGALMQHERNKHP